MAAYLDVFTPFTWSEIRICLSREFPMTAPDARSGYSQTAGETLAASVVIPSAPHPSSPPEHHATWLHAVFAALAAFITSPVGVAAVSALSPKLQLAAGAIEAGVVIGDKLTTDPDASPASLGAA